MLIQPYQESWVDDFNQIKTTIEALFLDLDINIHHVGSTSVRHLAAKSIIDIDISFGKNVEFETIKSGLETLDYYHNGDQGIKDREAFKRKKTNKKHLILDVIPHHLYVCPLHSQELKRHLAFRNYLTENEKERKQYEIIKYKIAKIANQDKKTYAQLKETQAKAFIEAVLVKVLRK